MTLSELADTLWNAGIALSFKDGVPVATPAAKLLALPGVAEALAEHRGAVLRCLKGFNGARLEGLVCARCFPDGAPADLTLLPLRHCPNPKCMVAGQPWAGPHYPRRS